MKVAGWIVFLAVGFVLGIGYERTLLTAQLETEKLYAARQRFFDWRRFTNHIREDEKAFGGKSLLFQSNVHLASLRTVQSGPLIVLQSPIDWQTQEHDYRLTNNRPLNDKELVMVQEGRSSSDIRLRMTLVNPGSKRIAIKEISMIEQSGIHDRPKVEQASISGERLPPGEPVSYQIVFHLPPGKSPKSVELATPSGSMTIPARLLIYEK